MAAASIFRQLRFFLQVLCQEPKYFFSLELLVIVCTTPSLRTYRTSLTPFHLTSLQTAKGGFLLPAESCPRWNTSPGPRITPAHILPSFENNPSALFSLHKKEHQNSTGTSVAVKWIRVCQCSAHGFDPSSGKIPRAAEQLNSCTTATEPVHCSEE